MRVCKQVSGQENSRRNCEQGNFERDGELRRLTVHNMVNTDPFVGSEERCQSNVNVDGCIHHLQNRFRFPEINR